MNASQKAAIRALRVLCALIGFDVREADKRVVEMMTANEHIEEAEKTAVEYVWDHLMGEPEEVSPEDMLIQYRSIKEAFDAE